MAGSVDAVLEATLLMICKQQEEILKGVQSLHTGEYLDRLHNKVDQLLASSAISRGPARREEFAECPSPGTGSEYSLEMGQFDPDDGLLKDRDVVFGHPGQFTGEAARCRASSVTSAEPALFSRSNSVPPMFSLPHSVNEEAADDPRLTPSRFPRLARPAARTDTVRWLEDNTVRRKSSHKYIIDKKRRDLIDKRPRLVRIVKSPYFEAVCSAMIILNVVNACWQTQLTASRVEDAFVSGAAYSDAVPAAFVTVQSFFTAFFLLEVGIRWAATGFFRFVSDFDCTWNWLDILTVSVGFCQLVLQYFQMHTALGIIFAVRCLRIVRLLRVFRMLRLFVFFRELRMLIGACIGGLRCYIWCCGINLFLMLVFGITLTTRTYTYILTSEQYADDEGARLLQGSFGTLGKSMLSLAQAVSGGKDWYELYDLLSMVGAIDCLLLLVFLSFSIYVVANAAAAIFVEGAINHAKHDTEFIIKQQLERGSESRKKLFDVFVEMDLDDDGTLTLEEFISHLNDDRVVAYFDAFQLDVCYATEIFSLLDADGSGKVDIHEFIDGCIKLKGEARHLELCLMQRAISDLGQGLLKIQACLEKSSSSKAAPIQGRTWPGFDVPKPPSEGAALGHALGRQASSRSFASALS